MVHKNSYRNAENQVLEILEANFVVLRSSVDRIRATKPIFTASAEW